MMEFRSRQPSTALRERLRGIYLRPVGRSEPNEGTIWVHVPELGLYRRLRFKQIRASARLCERLVTKPAIGPFLQLLGRNAFCSRMLVGFHRPFPSFQAAQSYGDRYGVPSHEHPCNTSRHLAITQSARYSDYPVLFYLQRLKSEVRTVLDIGGSAGNLFYCYDKYLNFGAEVEWTVNEVPANCRVGRELALERSESRLHFIEALSGCVDADLVLISGSLHYFDVLPDRLLRHLHRAPTHVIINRTPVVKGRSTVTIQDARDYYAISPVRILARSALLQSMDDAGYDLVDEWNITDFRLRIPLDPRASAQDYSGFYFRLKADYGKPAC